MNKWMLFFASAFFLFSSTAFAKDYPHKVAGVNLTIPDTWKVNLQPKVIEATPDGNSILVFRLLDDGNLKAALTKVDQKLNKTFTNLKMGNGQKRELNGMKAFTIDGHGKLNGTDVEILTAVLKSPTNKAILVMAFIPTQSIQTLKPQFKKVLKSLRPL